MAISTLNEGVALRFQLRRLATNISLLWQRLNFDLGFHWRMLQESQLLSIAQVMFLHQTKRSNKTRSRRGTAITELAITLPIVVFIVLATIETCSMLYLKQGLRISAYEGSRIAIVPGSKFENVKAGCDQILAARKIKNAAVTVTPTDFAAQPYGAIVQVKVTADCGSNSFFVPFLFSGRTLEGEMHMMLER